MKVLEKLHALSEKLKLHSSVTQTEEATKNAFIMPFISEVLGYDVFNPNEVTPEFVCDVGSRKGEKIDYAIYRDGDVQIVVECKKVGEELNHDHASQLKRYFHVTSARIAILTNGRHYHFFTDIDKANVMDEKPFLVIDLLNIDENAATEINKLTKSDFCLNSIISTAEELKYLGQLKRALSEEMASPSEDFVKYFASRVYEGSISKNVRQQFHDLLMRAISQYMNDQLNDRLKAAIKPVQTAPPSTSPDQNFVSKEDEIDNEVRVDEKQIETTLEEQQAFFIVKAIGLPILSSQRIVMRDNMSYMAVICDDNNRKPICRLHLNRAKKYIGFIDLDGKETKSSIDTIDDIYKFTNEILNACKRYV